MNQIEWIKLHSTILKALSYFILQKKKLFVYDMNYAHTYICIHIYVYMCLIYVYIIHNYAYIWYLLIYLYIFGKKMKQRLPCTIYPSYTIRLPHLAPRIAILRDYLANAKVSSASIPFCVPIVNLKAEKGKIFTEYSLLFSLLATDYSSIFSHGVFLFVKGKKGNFCRSLILKVPKRNLLADFKSHQLYVYRNSRCFSPLRICIKK